MVVTISNNDQYWIFKDPVYVKKDVIKNDVGYIRDSVIVLDGAGVEHTMTDREGYIRIKIKETE